MTTKQNHSQQNPAKSPETALVGFVECYDYGAQGAKAMRAFLEGRFDEAAAIKYATKKKMEEVRKTSQIKTASKHW